MELILQNSFDKILCTYFVEGISERVPHFRSEHGTIFGPNKDYTSNRQYKYLTLEFVSTP